VSGEQAEEGVKLLDVIDNSDARLRAYKLAKADLDFF